MDCPEDRRQYERIPLCAYGCGKSCVLAFGAERASADLVDISAGGARLRFKELQKAPGSKSLTLSVVGVQDNGRLQNLAAEVRWASGQEIGIKFLASLEIGVSDLQRMIC